MPFEFKVWNQGNDGQNMGIRVANANELRRFASVCTEPDLAGRWRSLQDYLNAARTATSEPTPYTRPVHIVWLNTVGYGSTRYFPGRTLVVTYTGRRRSGGGYTAQGYTIVDAQGYPLLGPHHRAPIQVEYLASAGQDVLVVLP